MPESPSRNPWAALAAPQKLDVRPTVVSPFMERLRTPVRRRVTRLWHLYDEIELLVTVVFASAVLRMLVCGMIGYWIGAAMAEATGPFVSRAGGRVVFETSAAATGGAWGALLGLSGRWFLQLVHAEAWIWLGIVIALAASLTTAASTLVGRLIQAFGALHF